MPSDYEIAFEISGSSVDGLYRAFVVSCNMAWPVEGWEWRSHEEAVRGMAMNLSRIASPRRIAEAVAGSLRS